MIICLTCGKTNTGNYLDAEWRIDSYGDLRHYDSSTHPTSVPALDTDDLARAAFWGARPGLADYLREKHGYEQDGGHYTANGPTLADFKTWLAALPFDELSLVLELDSMEAAQ